jgi:hypothetical protein
MQLHAALSEQGVAVRFCHRVAGTEASAGGYSTPLPRDAEVSPPTHCHCEPPLHLCTRGTWGHRASCNTNTSSSDGCRAIQHRTLQQIGPSVSPILMPCAYSELSARLSTPPSRPFYPTGSDAKPAASVCSSRLRHCLSLQIAAPAAEPPAAPRKHALSFTSIPLYATTVAATVLARYINRQVVRA